MSLLTKIRQYASRYVPISMKDMDVARGYNLWAAQYDAQPNNLMLKLDEKLVKGFIGEIDLENKSIADIGCGTGRHWGKLFSKNPARLLGYDVSAGMLEKLKEKYPQASVFELKDNLLPGIAPSSCDLIISTLTVAHIDDIETALKEWCRVLKSGGDMIITDYHPGLLAKGGDRSFRHKGKYVSIKNNVHSIEYMKGLFSKYGLVVLKFEEFFIDENVKQYYEQQGMLHVYEKNEGIPVIYGFHLKKNDAPPQLT